MHNLDCLITALLVSLEKNPKTIVIDNVRVESLSALRRLLVLDNDREVIIEMDANQVRTIIMTMDGFNKLIQFVGLYGIMIPGRTTVQYNESVLSITSFPESYPPEIQGKLNSGTKQIDFFIYD
jgi:hypothetical protein